MRLKFCGIRREEDIAAVNLYPPDYIGFVFAESRRQVTAAQAQTLCTSLAAPVQRVGVFVNMAVEQLLDIVQTVPLDVVQLHGDEDTAYIAAVRQKWRGQLWKAVRVRCVDDIRQAETLAVDALVLDSFVPDAYGGTGKTANFDVIALAQPRLPFLLAGGLNAENLPEAIRKTRPDGVDLSGGIETDGCKDRQKMKAIYELIRRENE